MRPGALVAATALATIGLLAGCDRTTPGTAAMPTESLGRATISSTPRTTTPRSTPGTSAPSSAPRTSPNGAPPSDVMTLTCADYQELDVDAQTAVIQEILKEAGPGSMVDPSQPEVAKLIVDATCTLLPEAVVSEFLVPPP